MTDKNEKQTLDERFEEEMDKVFRKAMDNLPNEIKQRMANKNEDDSTEDDDDIKKAMEESLRKAMEELPDEFKERAQDASIKICHMIDGQVQVSDDDIPKDVHEFMNLFAASEHGDEVAHQILMYSIDKILANKDYMIVPVTCEISGFIRVKANTPVEAVSFLAENYNEISNRLDELNLTFDPNTLKIPKVTDIQKSTISEYYGMVDEDIIPTIE